MSELIGHQIDHYRIDLLLGEGGMGAVYRAYDLNLDIQVALKLMHRHLGNQKEFQERFMQEARAAARLTHPSIVGVRYFGISQGLLYMVMNFVPGDSLAGFIRRLEKSGQAVQLRETLILIAQVADALGYAHQQGVIHRDIKPNNVMVQKLERPEREGEPALRAIVTDFGLAKLLIGGVETQSGAFLGTLPYMSPEQCLAQPLDGRSDIYSLGVMLYQLTTGQLPFDIKTPSDAVMKHLNEIPPAPRLIWPGLPASVEEIIQKAIAKKPEDRFQHAETLARELRDAAKQLTDAEVTNYIAQRTILNLETSFQQVSGFAEPSRMGFDLPSSPTRDRLIIAQKDHTPRAVPLNKKQLTIGRTTENDIVLDHPDISRQHARLEQTATGWQVTDLGSMNGTYLGKVKLLAAIPEDFLPQLTLRMGPFFVHWQRSEASTAQSSRLVASQVSQFRSRTGKIGLNIQPAKVEIMTGERIQVEVKLFNEDEMVDHLRLRVQGLPPAWVTLPEPVAELMPHQTAIRNFTIHPPQDSTVRAGSHSYQLVVESEAKPGEKATAPCEVVVKPFERFSVEFLPTQIVNGGTTRVTIRNEGNAEGIYSLSGRDPSNAVQFTGEHGRIRIPAGGSTIQPVTVKARHQATFGSAQTLPFELQVRSATKGHQVLAGQLKVTPLVPIWILPMLGVLLTLCFIGGGFGYFGWILPDRQNAEALTATSNAAMLISAQTATQAAQVTMTAGMITPIFTLTETPPVTSTLPPSSTWTPTETTTATASQTSTSTETHTPSPTPTEQIRGFPGTWISVRELPVAFSISNAISRLVITRVDQDTVTFSACRCNSASCTGQIELDPPKVVANLSGDQLEGETTFKVAENHTWRIKAIRSGNNLLVTVQETRPNSSPTSEPFEMKLKPFSPLGNTFFDSCEPPIFIEALP